MRLFIAVDPGAKAKEQLRVMGEVLRPSAPKARWVQSPQYHLTLAFLGEVDGDHFDWVIGAMLEASRVAGPFKMTPGGTGVFPSWREPRVLWIGVVEGEEVLSRLALTLRVALQIKGFPLENKAFEPHLTLCRSAESLLPLKQDAERYGAEEVWKSCSTTVSEIELIQSSITSTGPKHQVLHRTRLKGASA
ncbi:MAG: RNA 2',3'-cyclic phosphodiesterase [Elusimicrobia bacterium]|nr:RNA 2',3'-cyclic phosphodiesterase [Elusimicrobiota bacterium]